MVGVRGFILCAILAASQAAAGPTDLCNATPWTTKVDLYPVDLAVASRIQAAVASPASDPDFYGVLGNATALESRTVSSMLLLELSYPVVEDVAQIAQRMKPNYLLFGEASISIVGSGGCFGVPAAASSMVVTEYYNSRLDHYFLSSSSEENASIDQGLAGPGWARTGEQWTTYKPDECVVPREAAASDRARIGH